MPEKNIDQKYQMVLCVVQEQTLPLVIVKVIWNQWNLEGEMNKQLKVYKIVTCHDVYLYNPEFMHVCDNQGRCLISMEWKYLMYFVTFDIYQVLQEEKLAERAQHLGEIVRSELSTLNKDIVTNVRGKGLLNAVIIKETDGRLLWDVGDCIFSC